jgi:hypothetical protein
VGNGKRVALWVLAGFGAAALLGLFIYNKVMGEVASMRTDPQAAQAKQDFDRQAAVATRVGDGLVDVVDGFARAARAHDFAAAQSLTARAYRARVQPAAFARAIGANPYLTAGGTANVRRTTMFDGTARVEGTFRSAAGTVTLAADLSDEPDGWKLTGLILGGNPALP